MFFKIILFFVIFYFFFKLLFRVIIPGLLMRKLRKMGNEMNGGWSDPSTRQKDGKVTVTYKPSDNNGNGKSKEGEYVDFEEVE